MAEVGLAESIPTSTVDLWPSAEPYYAAYLDLVVERTYAIGMAGAIPNALPQSAITQFARDFGYAENEDEPKEFTFFARQLEDADFAIWKASQRRTNTKRG